MFTVRLLPSTTSKGSPLRQKQYSSPLIFVLIVISSSSSLFYLFFSPPRLSSVPAESWISAEIHWNEPERPDHTEIGRNFIWSGTRGVSFRFLHWYGTAFRLYRQRYQISAGKWIPARNKNTDYYVIFHSPKNISQQISRSDASLSLSYLGLNKFHVFTVFQRVLLWVPTWWLTKGN